MAMKSVNPQITQEFVAAMRRTKDIYSLNVRVGEQLIPIEVWPTVFPPKSVYSVSTRSLYEAFGDLAGMRVADVGCGTGIEAIVAVLAGASSVTACDINPIAVGCARSNVELNGLGHLVEVLQSDLFGSMEGRFDLVIANLPIVDFAPQRMDFEAKALYDPGLELHRRLLIEARSHLREGGVITFTHANLQSQDDFARLEEMIAGYGYSIVEKRSSEALGFTWTNYKITPTGC